MYQCKVIRMALLRYPNGWVGLDHEGLVELDGVLSLI